MIQEPTDPDRSQHDSITADDFWRRSPHTLWRASPDFLALCAVSGEVLTAAGSAAEVWVLLERPRSTHQLAVEIAGSYGLSISTITDDLVVFLDSLAEHEFVERLSHVVV